MIELDDWQSRPSAPPALALLKEMLNGSGPAVYKIGGKLYLDEQEADCWLARRRARPERQLKREPVFPMPGDYPAAEKMKKTYDAALVELAAGLREYDRYMSPPAMETAEN